MPGRRWIRGRASFASVLIAIAFLGYWTLLVYCDVWRPAPPGLSFQYAADGIHLADVVAGGPADRAGLRAGDRLLAVDNHPVSGRLDWMSVEANFEIGRPNRVTAERGGSIVGVELTPQLASWASWRAQHGPSLLLVRITQLATLSLGIFVALKRSRDPRALVGAAFLATAGVFSLAVPHRFASVWRALPLVASLPLWIPFINNVAIAAWGYSFFAMLPRRRAFRWWLWLLIWLPVAPGLVGNAMFGYATIVLGRPAPFWPWTATLIASGIAYVGAAVVALLKNYRRLDDVNERRRVRILTLGSLIGVLAGAPVVVSYWRGTESNLDQAFIASPLVLIGTLLFLALPLSFAYAILRHRLFDVGIMIRQGLRYAMARRALLAIVPILLLLLGADVMAHSDQPVSVVLRSRLWVYLAIGALAIVARSQRQRWLDALDRRFFRERYNGQRLLREVADDLRKSEGLEPAASVVAARVEQALHCTFVALALRDPRGSGYRAVAVFPPGHTPPSIAADNRVLTLTALLGQPVEVSESATGWLARKLPSADIRAVQAADIELLVPIRSGHRQRRCVSRARRKTIRGALHRRGHRTADGHRRQPRGTAGAGHRSGTRRLAAGAGRTLPARRASWRGRHGYRVCRAGSVARSPGRRQTGTAGSCRPPGRRRTLSARGARGGRILTPARRHGSRFRRVGRSWISRHGTARRTDASRPART